MYLSRDVLGGSLNFKNKFNASSKATYTAYHASTYLSEVKPPFNSYNNHGESKNLIRKVHGSINYRRNELVAKCIRSEIIADNSISTAFKKSAIGTETNLLKRSKAHAICSPLLRSAISDV